jgi:hypothetical protein
MTRDAQSFHRDTIEGCAGEARMRPGHNNLDHANCAGDERDLTSPLTGGPTISDMELTEELTIGRFSRLSGLSVNDYVTIVEWPIGPEGELSEPTEDVFTRPA